PIRPQARIFTDSRASWSCSGDELPAYPGSPPQKTWTRTVRGRHSSGPTVLLRPSRATHDHPPLLCKGVTYGGLWSHGRTRDLASIDFAPQAGAHCARVMGVSFRPRCKKQSVPSADRRQLCQVTGHFSYLAVELPEECFCVCRYVEDQHARSHL